MEHVRIDMEYDKRPRGSSVRDITDMGTMGAMPWPYFGFSCGPGRIMLSSGTDTWGVLCVF